jgi:hypothetical protein
MLFSRTTERGEYVYLVREDVRDRTLAFSRTAERGAYVYEYM